MPTALITGASAGIGAEFARQLAATGYERLALVARRVDRLQDLATELADRHGTTIEILPADLGIPEDRARVVVRLQDLDHPIDLLVNDAGLGNKAPASAGNVADEIYLMQVNAIAKMELTLHALQTMLARNHGSIINVASIAAEGPAWLDTSYYPSVAAVLAHTEGLAYSERLRRSNVRIMALCPGDVHTEFNTAAGLPDKSDFGWIPVDKLVAAALRDLQRGRIVSRPTLRYKLLAFAMRLVPDSWSRLYGVDIGVIWAKSTKEHKTVEMYPPLDQRTEVTMSLHPPRAIQTEGFAEPARHQHDEKLCRMLPPGPRTPAFVQGLGVLRSPYGFLERCADKYGPTFTLNIPGFGQFVLVSQPDDVERVFTAGPDQLAAGRARAMLAPIFGWDSLLTADGPAVDQQRKLLLPHFRRREALIRGEEVAIEATHRAITSWPRGSEFELYPRLESITMDVIVDRFLGRDPGPDTEDIKRICLDFVHCAHKSAIYHLPALIDKVNLGPYRRYRTTRARYQAWLDLEFARRRPAQAGEDRLDLIGVLQQAPSEEESIPLHMRQAIVTAVLGAGHETTSIAASWAMEWILSQPEVETRIRAELETVLDGQTLTFKHLERLDYLDAVIAETMRLTPINPLIPRIVVAESLRIAGYDLPRGTHVVVNAYAVHHRPDSWPDPERFDPRRFLNGRRTKYAWIPFGGGTRKCIGMAFAQHELKAIIATLFAETRLRKATLASKREVPVGDMAAPRDGVRVLMTSRGAP